MINVSLINPNFQTGPVHLNSFYLPYTAGTLWAYSMADERLAKNFKINNWIFKRDPIDQAVKDCKGSDIALLSIYIWNQKYTYALAEKLKEAYPNIKIIIGGPQLEWRDDSYFEKYPFIDSIVIGEGEAALKHLLECYLDGKELPKRNQFERIKDLDLPSPYLTGLFDPLLKEYPDIDWVPTLESDRGCPYACTFCDWGSATASKMYKFYTERIVAEIDWFVKNKLTYMNLTNSNFGVFKERDLFIAETIAKHTIESGYPKALTVSYAKNNNALVLDIVKLFMDAEIQTGVTISLQTASETVLENIKRSNMKINKVKEISSIARDKNLPISTELILGLPGETYDSWKDTLDTVLEAKIVTMDIFYLQLLVNAPMYVNDMDKYNLETFHAYDYFYDFNVKRIQEEITEGIAESIEVIKSTNSMSNNELLRTAMFSWFLIGAHSYGLAILLADYVFKQGIKYTDFYESLFEYLQQNNNQVKEWSKEFIDLHHRWYKLGYVDRSIGAMPNIGYGTMQSFVPLIQASDSMQTFLESIGNFAKDKYNVSDNVISDYKKLTDLYIKQFGKYIKEPIQVDLDSDILNADFVRVEDRYNQFPETKQIHMEYQFLSIKKSWHLNKISVDKK